MYQYSYGEILADSPVDARVQEREALDQAIGLLHVAAAKGPGSIEAVNALTFTTQLWALFIQDLAHPQNDLPDEVRARLMSIGLWILAEAGRIQNGESDGFIAIAEICGTIRDGLK